MSAGTSRLAPITDADERYGWNLADLACGSVLGYTAPLFAVAVGIEVDVDADEYTPLGPRVVFIDNSDDVFRHSPIMPTEDAAIALAEAIAAGDTSLADSWEES